MIPPHDLDAERHSRIYDAIVRMESASNKIAIRAVSAALVEGGGAAS